MQQNVQQAFNLISVGIQYPEWLGFIIKLLKCLIYAPSFTAFT